MPVKLLVSAVLIIGYVLILSVGAVTVLAAWTAWPFLALKAWASGHELPKLWWPEDFFP